MKAVLLIMENGLKRMRSDIDLVKETAERVRRVSPEQMRVRENLCGIQW